MGSKFVFQVVWFLVATYSACRFANTLTSIRRAGRFPPGPARLRVLGMRGGSAPLSVQFGPLFASAGLLRDGCKLPVDGGGAALALDNDGTLHLGNSLGVANGYYFATIGGESAIDPVRWVVEVSADNGSTWDPVGASIWRFTTSGSPLLFPGLAYPKPSPQSAVRSEVRVDSRPQLSWILTTATEQLNFALLYFMMATAGRLGRADLIVPFAAVTLSLNAIFILAGISIAERSMWREAVRLAMYAIGYIFLALSTAREKHFIPALAAGNIFIMTSASIVEVVLYGRDLKPILQQQLVSLASVSGSFSLIALFIRHSALASAHSLVKLDRDRYDALWSESLFLREALQAVSEQAHALVDSTQHRKARHLCPALSRKFTAAPVRFRSTGCLAYMLGINKADDEYLGSLDQLFVQAWCLNPLLLRKVQTWALKSHGCFPCVQAERSCTTFVRYEDAIRCPDVPIKWASVKSTQRAIEKLTRAYEQDVSRLVDVCRQSIIFDDLSDIALCLATMRTDPEIQIVRVKNRLDPGYNAAESGGYRDVMVNLKMLGTMVEELGLDGHVCESDEGHKRYVAFRNLRAE